MARRRQIFIKKKQQQQKKKTNKQKLEQVDGALAYPRASAISYVYAHQDSKCLPPVFIHRAIITCDSFKVLAQKSLRGVVWQ